MSYEDSAGLGVHNQYGPRTSGGSQGKYRTAGIENDYVLDLPLAGLYNKMPVRQNIKITEIDANFVIGTITSVTVGGVSVYDSTTAVALPVAIPEGNTGEVVVVGATGGKLVLKYENVGGDAFPLS